MTTTCSSSDPLSSKNGCHSIEINEVYMHNQITFVSDEKAYHKKLELHKAALKGEEDKIFPSNGKVDCRAILRSPITSSRQTILHLATGAKQTKLVEKMLERLEKEDLEELKDVNENNAFCYAAMAGAKEIAGKMYEKNRNLLRIRGAAKMTPLYMAALFGHQDMASFLYDKYEGMDLEDEVETFYRCIDNHLFDLALKMLNHNPTLAVSSYEDRGTPLHMLAECPSAFASKGVGLIEHQMDLSNQALKLLDCLLEKILQEKGENFGKYMRENKELLFKAAKLGNSNFLKKLISFYPDLARQRDETKDQTIFHIAVFHRHVAIFNLMDDIGFDKQLIARLEDKNGNNLLHLAATYSTEQRPASIVPGAALEMQQELKAFKEVALLVSPSYRKKQNNEKLTPREIFTRDHKELMKNGEKWMKVTAESCMLVATIIATVVFATGFSVPGDYNDDGIPNQLKNVVLYSSFGLVNAVALLCSSISMLMFVSILASHFEEEDFLKPLPIKLMVGLLTLFISIATMMLSFSLSFFLSYKDRSKVVPILICTLLFVPTILFPYSQRQLLKDMFYSSFHSRFSCKPIEY